ncbi:MAG: NADPH:quinone oxidoreductase family protein [Proteobacteria bacterium]|nr:NADPH:quinone oxidoreductase family protein [Pseudomonadota bacterium]
MRALLVEDFGPFETHGIKELPDPAPGPGEVIVEARAMGLNFPDLLMVEGKYQHQPARPFIPGFDAAGVVSAVGEGVGRVALGDRVLVSLRHGAFATRVTAPEQGVWRMPEAMSFEHGAAFGLAYLTAYISLLENAGAKAGETVLITGASGGVGLAMVQFGAARGMRIIGGATSAEKALLAQENGAESTVDLASENLRDSLREEIYALTEGAGVDLVVDLVGGDVFDAAIRAIRPGGRIAIVGFAGGRIAEIRTNYLLNKRLSAIGSPLTSGRDGTDALKDRAMAELLRLYEAGGLRPVISARIAFDDWREGFRRFRERRVTGKMVMAP